jgi:hypothetical protein
VVDEEDSRPRCPKYLGRDRVVCTAYGQTAGRSVKSTMSDGTYSADPEPPATVPPKSRSRWPLIAGVIAIGLVVLGAIVWSVGGPDREACKSAVGKEIDALLASNQPMDSWKDDSKLQARIKTRVTWPCRFQSDSDLESIAAEVGGRRSRPEEMGP